MLETLGRASLEGAILAVCVWILLWAVPKIAPSVKALLWWCVALKFVVALLPVGNVRLAVLPHAMVIARSEPIATPALHSTYSTPLVNGEALSMSARPVNVASSNAAATALPNVSTILLILWVIGIGWQLSRTFTQWRRLRGIIARSMPAASATQTMLVDIAARLGLQAHAELRTSSEVDSPLIVGVRNSVILVPAQRFPLMSTEQQRMVICHELAHLKRRDVLFSCIPAAAERLFFFHPLTRLAAREYAFWREASCDAAVLAALKTPARSYGRLLLDLGVASQPAHAVANAAMSYSTLKRRLVMLNRPFMQSTGARIAAAGAIGLAMIALAPVRLVARTNAAGAAGVTTSPSADSSTPTRDSSPIAVRSALAALNPPIFETDPPSAMPLRQVSAPARVIARTHETNPLQVNAVPVQQAPARLPERTQEADQLQAPPALHESRSTSRSTTITQLDSQDRFSFVLFNDESSTTMSGSSRDIARAREFRRSGEQLLWFRLDGREYVIRNPAILREARQLWERVNKLGEEQGRIGAQQGEIGARQGEIGARQGRIAAEQGVLAARQGTLAARQGQLAARESRGLSAWERDDIARERQQIDRELRQLDREMREVGDRLRVESAPMDRLGSEMTELGRQMSLIGQQMSEESRRADRRMRDLVESAIDSGAARRVD